MNSFFQFLEWVNSIMLSMPVLCSLLGAGVLFTIWSGFSQYRSLTHGTTLILGRGIESGSTGKGALTHFQALTAAISGTVGLGNIAGVAIAVEFGGPGAVFWMWIVGLFGMAIKSTEVTLSLLYRDDSDPDDPHGGTMYVCRNGLSKLGPGWKRIAKFAGAFFCISMIVFAVTGGNVFQAWSVTDTTQAYFGVPTWLSGTVLAVLVALVVLGGVKRLGATAGKLVPLMCLIYVLAGLFVLTVNADQIPDAFRLIFASAFAPAEAVGAFTGASIGMAFIFGMKRALFSSEAGLGTAPIAHSAVKTSEPVTEGVVAGLEPFIDTLVVCTITALVIITSGVWNRGASLEWETQPALVSAGDQTWTVESVNLDGQGHEAFADDDPVFVVIQAKGERQRLTGKVVVAPDGQKSVDWRPIKLDSQPEFAEDGLYEDIRGATLAARSFDSAQEGLGKWMVTAAVWLFGLSTIITYAYYGEQGVRYFGGGALAVRVYRVAWCLLVGATGLGFVTTIAELDILSTVALGFMLIVNLPVMVLLGSKAMAAWKDYFERLDSGEIRRSS